jgi:hypothetical protein
MTLIEVLVSMTILLMAFMILFNLFHACLRYNSRLENRVLASVIAGKTVEEIRNWAWTESSGLYNFDSDWHSYSGLCRADAEHPGYQVRVVVRDMESLSPCVTIEDGFPEQRTLSSSLKKVKVTVSWDPLDSARQFDLYSVIREPPRTFDRITIGAAIPLPPELAPNETAKFIASAWDTGGRELADLFFKWYVHPIDGNGTLTYESRDGKRATFCNKVMLPDGSWGYSGGSCKVYAQARYRGVTKIEYSQEIRLATP